MGRMLDTFKQGEGRRVPLSIGRPAEEPAVQDCVVDWEIGAEVPYVEVGGADKKVELSPGLMKHAPQPATQPPHMPVDVPASLARTSVVKLTETKPMAVAFEPWPNAAPSSLGVSSEIIAYHQPDHATSLEYARLTDSICSNLTTSRVLMLIGARPRVGVSTVLLNLAVCAAQKKNLRVALLDLNAARPALAVRMGCGLTVGLGEVLCGSLALEHAIVKTPVAKLHLLPAGTPGKRPTAEAISWLLESLRERFDLILLDGATVDDESVLAAMAGNTDGIYLVLPQNEAAPLNKGIAQNLSRLGGRLCGLIHTHFEI